MGQIFEFENLVNETKKNYFQVFHDSLSTALFKAKLHFILSSKSSILAGLTLNFNLSIVGGHRMHGHLIVIHTSGIVSFNFAWLGWEI